MTGALLMRAYEFVADHYGAAVCLGLGLTVIGMFCAVALVRGGK